MRRSWVILGLVGPLSVGAVACEPAETEQEEKSEQQSAAEQEADLVRRQGERAAQESERRAEEFERAAQQHEEAAEQHREATERRAQALESEGEAQREQQDAQRAQENLQARMQQQQQQQPGQTAEREAQQAEEARRQAQREQQEAGRAQDEQAQQHQARLQEQQTEHARRVQQPSQGTQQMQAQPMQGAQATAPSAAGQQVGVASLESPKGEPVTGTVVVTQSEAGQGVVLQATVAGLEPGRHEISVGDASDCEEAQPGQQPPQTAQAPTQEQPQAVGEIEVGPDGAAQYRALVDQASLGEGSEGGSMVGRAVIIKDPGATDPLACGVVQSSS